MTRLYQATMNGVEPPSQNDASTKVPFNQRWELLKPVIEHLYLDEDHSLSKVKQIMKDYHNFDAEEHQYKYYINRKWKLKKNLPTSKKAIMSGIHLSRAATGKATTFQFQGREVDQQKLRRYVKDEKRKKVVQRQRAGVIERGLGQSSSFSLSTTRLIIGWNTPFGTMALSGNRVFDAPSPCGPISPPSDVDVQTPGQQSLIAEKEPSSPLSRDLVKKQRFDRAYMFLEGRHDELLKSMDKQESRIASTWLYQFWKFAFVTAKHWGHGPHNWTAELLGFAESVNSTTPSPFTPVLATRDPTEQSGRRTGTRKTLTGTDNHFQRPSSLCRWSIHVRSPEYEPVPEDYVNGVETSDKDSWRDWPQASETPDIQDRLRDGLETNSFSNIDIEALPMALSQVLRSETRPSADLAIESLSFAIMAGNYELVERLLDSLPMDYAEEQAVAAFRPLHLATTYLHGSRTCCKTVSSVLTNGEFSELADNLGHTPLDNLMIAILKAHTICSPSVVNNAWRTEVRFPGEEVDICGRWDGDSDCIRAISGSVNPKIPLEWKHKFCHTSALTICHCISHVAEERPTTFIKSSGLFVRRCAGCGLKLQLEPLHAAMVVAWLLAEHGREGEDLFGMVAVLLCLLQGGVDPRRKTSIQLSSLAQYEESDGCNHQEMTPAGLAASIQDTFAQNWSGCLRIGWQCLRRILERSQAQWEWDYGNCAALSSSITQESSDVVMERTGDSPTTATFLDIVDDPYGQEALDISIGSFGGVGLDNECHFSNGHYSYFGIDGVLGQTWAAVQTELLTYRRIAEGDSWNSANFNMHALADYLSIGGKLSIGLVDKKLMKTFCGCGIFRDRNGFWQKCATMEDVSSCYFANLEDWSRITVIPLIEF